ncbi:MAG: Uma2 family endonuclease [Planctomycetota bacterium]
MTPAADILDSPAVRSVAWRMTVQQYQKLSASGVVPQKTELIRGVVIDKMTKPPRSSWMSQLLADWLRANVASGHHVRQEQPLTLGDSEPEPDIAVVRGGRDNFRQAHPRTATLVIEIAVTSGELDRQKAAIYA